MGWMDQVNDILRRYSGSNPNMAGDAPADFEKIAQHAPPSVLSSGLAEAFRSPNTPEFGQMVAQLFGNSNGEQRAGILNHLLASAGPAAGELLRKLGVPASGGAPSAQTSQAIPTVTPDQTQQVHPDTVRELAEQAQKRDPSIVERASDFYAQHPKLVQGLGAAALALLMSRVSQRH